MRITKKRLNRTNKNKKKTEKTKKKMDKKRKNKTMKKRGGSLHLDKLPIRYYYQVNDEINNPNTPASITNARLATSNIHNKI